MRGLGGIAGELALGLAAGSSTAVGAAVLFAVGPVAAFSGAVLANGFGMRGGPHVRTECGVVGITG